MVHMCQICFNVKLNMLLYMHSVHNVSNNIIEKLNGSRTKQASNNELSLMSKMTYMYIMCFPTLLPVLKNRETVSIQRTREANYIGSIIG